MEIEKLKKTTIERLKKVKAEQGLSVSRIMEMLEAKGKFVSEATVKRIFSEGSEEFNFRYQDSIAPLADVLLDGKHHQQLQHQSRRQTGLFDDVVGVGRALADSRDD